MSARFLPAGDAGLVVELGDAIDLELNARVRALDRALVARPFDGYLEAIPSYRSLLVFYDPRRGGFDGAVAHIRGLLAAPPAGPEPEPELKEIPTVYDGEDLEEVAERLGATREDVVRLHSEREYRVYVVGFTPGFAYMGRTHPKLDLPRRSTPRTRVPAGSVAIAMGQTGVYPSDTPGGWHLLGRADPRSLFDVDAKPPSRFVAGDRVRFVPVEALVEPTARPRPAAPPRGGFDALAVEDGGLSTTVQDLGRPGFQRYGVPVAGAADSAALIAANRSVGNPDGAAALECTVQGPRLRALTTVVVALSGADLGAVVERADLGRWRPSPEGSFLLRQGNVLAFEGRRSGARAYLAVAGGIDVPVVLGSRSTYLTAGFGGLEGRPLRPGDRIAVRSRPPLRLVSASAVTTSCSEAPVRILWGPQDDYFGEDGRRTLVSARFVVAPSSDRMGCRLRGPLVAHRGAREIISDGNALGSIQIPPDGQPIVMLADRATTGGYPKIATVVSEDVGRVAQRLPGDSLSFRAVELRRGGAAGSR